MARMAVRESVTLAGRAERARVARMFTGEVLGLGHPYGEVAVLLVSELFGNSVRHSASGRPGETITVAVAAWDGAVRVEVTDRSEKLSETLLAFVERYNRTAEPFSWKYTADDLRNLLRRLSEHSKQDTVHQSGLVTAA